MTLINKAEALAALRNHAKGKTVLGGQVYQSLTLETALEAIAALPARGVGVKPPFCFDRYINGVRMAEDVCIERETTLEGAMQAAARIAAKGPNGEAPVLVYRALPAVTQPVWPDFIAPPKYDNPDPRWVDPALPDFRLIWKVARECGYAVGLHGSMKRDCDLIAVPWTDEAVLAFDLIYRLCKALNAQVLGPAAGKPHGRLGWNLQIDGYVKVIDISVVPRSQDRAALTATATTEEGHE